MGEAGEENGQVGGEHGFVASVGGGGVFRSVLIALHLIHRGRISKMMLKVADRAIRPSAFSWGIHSCLPSTVITGRAS